METVYNWCKKSYPKLMTRDQVDALYSAEKLTIDEYENVINGV